MRTSAVLLVIALAALPACSVTRVYKGQEIRIIPQEHLRVGVTTKGDVLRLFGPPSGLSERRDGEVFVYTYERRNAESLEIEEPVFTGIELFSYTRSRRKEDRLMIFFNGADVVKEYGFTRGTRELDGL